ncbi:PTS glucose transporter subunit IIA [Rhodococcus fascians]|uniref:beta-glucoside-specific PTS transporter subunit IIABC n=1 Tax=Rhodococcoides fascians TaxID=1828 RepID=UPI00195F9AAE|nr:beta-glucoside-specific PTS transporter subunit IIABC [Rhodococcus fascians]MBM7244435.1 PTS glucose transporter subunit IIA [Rhodococcus fascians]MBY3808039.1 PTS glucose transporter subunit IIA [Rhodococcus fascians]MBY3839587.1 PTS glucose transporter subunit IIA [Rhodococcus fascians]MBY3847850.1 PTS glucose transporter subunit IIA [Rhodococcus fascians]MBY3851358.1 PTS glucose transporter subunit IIA [Rhodococcus fascians]
MAIVDHRSLASDILEGVGGEGNVDSVVHCATRLRFKLRETARANTDAVKALPGVLTVMKAGGQYQVVIGDDVPSVHAEITKLTGGRSTTEGTAAVAVDGSAWSPKRLVNGFIDVVSSIFQPIMWPLAGAGLLKALLSIVLQFGWLDATSQSYVILAAAADSIFYFLPIFLGYTAANRLGANKFTSMVIAGALVYPSIVELSASGEPVRFFSIPVTMFNYTSSVIPIIVAVLVQSHLEKTLMRFIPKMLRNFATPMISIIVMVPLVLLTVGPITSFLASALSTGIGNVFEFAPWLAGGLLGGLWQVFVLFGLHWGFLPTMLNDIAVSGSTVMLGPLPSAVLAQAAATLAVFLRTRSKVRRGVAGPAAVSGFVAGVTEPAIYGVNLPLKKPFFFGIAGGAVGGAVAASGGRAATTFVFPSLLGLSAFTTTGNFVLQIAGVAIAIGIAFALTFVFVDRENTAEAESIDATAAVGTVEIVAPVDGTIVALADVPDRVFSSGVLGQGFGVVPSEGVVRAPVSGTVITAMKTGHAYGIRSSDGVEVLVHIGIDTVRMNGEGFRPSVARGAVVNAGDILAEFDIEAVLKAGFDPMTLVVVTNSKQLASIELVSSGAVSHGTPAIAITV